MEVKKFITGWGFARQLRRDVLPTHGDLVDFYFFQELKVPTLSKNDIFKTICRMLTSIWLDAGANPMGITGVNKKVLKLLKNISNLKKTSPWKRNRSKFPMVDCLFDIGSCKCLRGKRFQQSLSVDHCDCPAKLSESVVEFINDQRSERHMRIVDGGFRNVGHAIVLPTIEDELRNLYHNKTEDDSETINDGDVFEDEIHDCQMDDFGLEDLDDEVDPSEADEVFKDLSTINSIADLINDSESESDPD